MGNARYKLTHMKLEPVPICDALRSTALSVPPELHQSWYNRTLPTAVAPLVARWRAVLPHWKHRVWSDDDNRRLWKEHFPELLDLYDGYDVPIKRADATRLVYMAVFGGVYADLDVAPCDRMRATQPGRHQLLLVREPKKLSPQIGEDLARVKQRSQPVTNFFMASASGHPFWRFALQRLRPRRDKEVMSAAGPWFLNSAWLEFSKQAEAGGCGQLLAKGTRVYTFVEWQATLASHHWSGSWHWNGTMVIDRHLHKWMGVDLSKNCPENSFELHINRTWMSGDDARTVFKSNVAAENRRRDKLKLQAYPELRAKRKAWAAETARRRALRAEKRRHAAHPGQ